MAQKTDLPTQIKIAGLPAPKTEATFHETRQWRWDYAWPDLKIAVEVQGGIHTRGRHTRAKGYTGDCEKLDEAQLLGWLVLWVTYEQIGSGQALAWIERAIRLRTESIGKGEE